MKRKLIFGVVALFVITAFSSCAALFEDDCPYLIGNPHVELGCNDGVHNYAGAYFSFYNGSSKTVDEFTVSFLLFDGEGNSPFIGSNQVTATIRAELSGGEADDYIVNLDSYLNVIPSEPYEMDYVYVKSIRYSDGTVWKDSFGMHAVREAEH